MSQSQSYSQTTSSPPNQPTNPPTPLIMTYQQTGPSFAFCGTFSGQGNISAARWLKKFDHEMAGYKTGSPPTIPPNTYLDSLSMLLTDEAAEWSESHPTAVHLLGETSPTSDSVSSFRALLCERFPSKAIEITPIPLDLELSDLHQNKDEPLSAYYQRVVSLMQRVGAKDRSLVQLPVDSTLTTLESTMLDTILRAFIRGISDIKIRQEATRGMASANRSLKNIYLLAEEARRTSLEIQKLFDEEIRSDELSFYKSLAQQNLSKTQIDSLLTAYQAKKQEQPAKPRWTFNPDPVVEIMPSQLPTYYPPPQPQPQAQGQLQRQPYPQNRNDNYQQRANGGNPNNKGRSAYQGQKDIPNRSESKNPWINGSRQWAMSRDGRLCVKCGNLGHIATECADEALPAWEQSYLREIVFGQVPQVSFAASGYSFFDSSAKPYGGYSILSNSSSSGVHTPQESSIPTSSGGLGSPSSHSIHYGTAGLLMPPAAAETKYVEANYGEGSGQNKRLTNDSPLSPTQPTQADPNKRRVYVEDSESPPTQQIGPPPQPQPQPAPQFQQPQYVQPEPQPAPQQQQPQPPVQPEQPQPAQQFVPQPQPVQQPSVQPQNMMPQYQAPALPQFQFQPAPANRPKAKAQKKVGKKIEPAPVVGMFNDQMGKYDSPISIRYLLQNNKVDITWMDLVAWSPSVAREIKRMCTRVTKKRMPKAKKNT